MHPVPTAAVCQPQRRLLLPPLQPRVPLAMHLGHLLRAVHALVAVCRVPRPPLPLSLRRGPARVDRRVRPGVQRLLRHAHDSLQAGGTPGVTEARARAPGGREGRARHQKSPGQPQCGGAGERRAAISRGRGAGDELPLPAASGACAWRVSIVAHLQNELQPERRADFVRSLPTVRLARFAHTQVQLQPQPRGPGAVGEKLPVFGTVGPAEPATLQRREGAGELPESATPLLPALGPRAQHRRSRLRCADSPLGTVLLSGVFTAAAESVRCGEFERHCRRVLHLSFREISPISGIA